MDPELQQAYAKLQAARQQAIQNGETPSPARDEKYLRALTGGRYGLSDVSAASVAAPAGLPAHGAAATAVDNAANAGLWGLGTKLSAAAASVAHSSGHDLSMYKFYLDALQKQKDQNASANPVSAMGGSLAGAIASPLNQLLPVGGATLPGVLAKGAAGGAIAGAVSGAGDSRQGRELAGAGKGAALGAVFGSALPGIAATGRSAIDPLTFGAARVAGAIAKSGGTGAIATEAQRLASLGKGNDVMLADLSPRLRALADEVANTNPESHTDLQTATMGRQAGQAERLLSDVRGGLNGTDPSLAVRQTALETSRRAWANEAYGALREANPTVDGPAFQQAAGQLIAQPKISSVWKDAKDIGLIGPLPDAAAQAIKAAEANTPQAQVKLRDWQEQAQKLRMMMVPEDKIAKTLGPPPEIPTAAPSFAMVHNMKQSLDDATSAAYRQGRGDLASRLKGARDAIDGFLTQSVPNYGAVNAEYAARRAAEDALQAGAEAWGKNDVQGLAQQASKLTPGQMEQFRYGMAAKLVEDLSSAKTNRDVASRLINASTAEQNKLRLIFGDQDTFQRFMQQVGAEQQMGFLKGATGGSATARRLAATANTLAAATGAIGWLMHNPAAIPGMMLVKGAEHLGQKALQQQAAAATPILMTKGNDAIQNYLRALNARPAALLPASSQQAMAGVGGLFGGLLGGSF